MSDLKSILAGAAVPPEHRTVDQVRIERAIREVLLAVGEGLVQVDAAGRQRGQAMQQVLGQDELAGLGRADDRHG